MATVRETFDDLARRFRAERAQGLRAVIQFDITGEGGGTYHAEIADGTCALREGPAPAPALSVTATAADWLEMRAGKLNPQVAFMSGRLRHRGDMSLLMRLAGMFDL